MLSSSRKQNKTKQKSAVILIEKSGGLLPLTDDMAKQI